MVTPSNSLVVDPPGPAPLLRVFLVEDFPAARDLFILRMAETPGLELTGSAETEVDALEWLRVHDCDVLILDLELKQGNGIGMLKALASAGRRPPPVKIVYSNHATPKIRELAAKFGATHFFDKTLDASELWRLLESLLRKNRSDDLRSD